MPKSALSTKMAPETPNRKRLEVNAHGGDHIHQDISEQRRYSVASTHKHVNGTSGANAFRFGNTLPVLTTQMSLPLPEEHWPATTTVNQSLLIPPGQTSKERRHSTSSCDSSTSQGSGRRLRRNSSCRLSDPDSGEDKKDVTLLTFLKAAQTVGRKIVVGLRKAASLLFVTRPKGPNIVCEADVIEQAVWIGTDYIISRLSSRQLMSRKVGLTASEWPKSNHVINAGSALELSYPKIYSNVSRKLCMTMSSPKVVRTTLSAVFKILFEENITWGKIVSMFAVAGLFAEECASQGHADYVKDVVDVIVDCTSVDLLPWLVSQGGWDAFPTPENAAKSRLSRFRLLLLAAITTTILMSISTCAGWWTEDVRTVPET